MSKIILFVSIIVSFSAIAFDIGFERGNEMSTLDMRGRATVYCNSSSGNDRGPEYKYYNCDDTLLLGGDYGAIVVTNGSVDADWLKLQREGSKYIKGARFNTQTGKTKYNYNLWIRTVFQKPLLKMGENVIKYTFTKRKKVVASGTFTVYVNEGEVRQCRSMTLFGYGSCPSRVMACDDLYRRQNYCK